MKILIVSDILEWAIGALSNVIRDENQHLDIKVIAIHPKDLRNNPDFWKAKFTEELASFKPDLVHFQYWDHIPYLSPLVNCKKILTHHNQKNLLSHDWHELDHIVVHTKKAKEVLNNAGYQNVTIIQHGIDIEKFKFLDGYKENRMIGYTGRIVPWKGLYEILKAANELDAEVIMMGRIDNGDYWAKCQEFADNMDIRFGTPSEEQVNVYHEMGVYVGNSCDGIEEGPLGLLEAMACGIPVITTKSGEAADIIKDRENGIIIEFENYENLKAALKAFFEMPLEQKEKMRQKAWDTVRHMSRQRMGRLYEKLYYGISYQKDLVSIIIPTFNRAGTITKVLDAYKEQTYKPIELIVVDDNSADNTEEIVKAWGKVKYIKTGNDGYGLAQARNMGIFEASGHYLIFNDDRLVPEKDAVERFIHKLSSIKEKAVVWGNKGAGKRDFIENFFAVRKRHIAEAGMFNERVNRYGGQSQEVRARLRAQGFILEYCNDAVCKPLFGTRKSKRRYDIFKSKLQLWKLES
jgi:glycosyltransferase involved in cell wall biosynthesis